MASKPIRKILYATDYSESSVPAGEYALTIGRMAGAELHVLHVIGEFADKRQSMVQPEAMVLLEREVEKQAVREMEIFCQERFGDGIRYRSEVLVGLPFEAILQRAESLPADLIVVGTHGRTGLERVFVGSTAERLVRRSKIPVLTVRGVP